VMVFDRRIMGGGPAGRVFMHFKHLLENADQLLAEKIEAKPSARMEIRQSEPVSN